MYDKLMEWLLSASEMLMVMMSCSHLMNDNLVTPFSQKGIASGPGSGMLYKSQGSSDDTAYADIKFKNVLTVETYSPPGLSDSGESVKLDLAVLVVGLDRIANVVGNNSELFIY